MLKQKHKNIVIFCVAILAIIVVLLTLSLGVNLGHNDTPYANSLSKVEPDVKNTDLQTLFAYDRFRSDTMAHSITAVVNRIQNTEMYGNDNIIDGESRRLLKKTTNSVYSGDSKPAQRTTVAVQIDGAPNGIRKYSFRINTTTDAPITSIKPGLIKGRFFRVAAGGEGTGSATIQGIDFIGLKQSFDESKRLFTITFENKIVAKNINVTKIELSNDNGGQIDQDHIRTVIMHSETTFSDPVMNNAEPPNDLDRDGLYEDVNGDGQTSLHDAVELALIHSDSLTDEQVVALDFNGDGKVSLLDSFSILRMVALQ